MQINNALFDSTSNARLTRRVTVLHSYIQVTIHADALMYSIPIVQYN